MHNVIHLFDRNPPTVPATERLQAMSARKAGEFALAARDNDVLISALAVIPHGHYARIIDAGVVKVVVVYTNQVQLVNGVFTVSKFADSMPPDMRYLTASLTPEDLGDYQTFIRANMAIWRLVLKSLYCPPAGLAMVQAIDHLLRSATPLDRESVDVVLAELAKYSPADSAVKL